MHTEVFSTLDALLVVMVLSSRVSGRFRYIAAPGIGTRPTLRNPEGETRYEAED